jgi:hypothetical protein
LTGAWRNLGHRSAIRRLRSKTRGWRRRAAGGGAGYGGERRREGENGAGVHQTMRGLHWNDDERLANPLMTLPGGDGEGRRRAASNSGGGAPTMTRERRDARNRALKPPACSSPSHGSIGGFPTADERRTGGDGGAQARRPARVRALAAALVQLGFWAAEAEFWASRRRGSAP